MQVPHMANRILSFVTSQNIMAEVLFLELRDINVFKVWSAKAQIRNTGIMPNMWWEDGKSLGPSVGMGNPCGSWVWVPSGYGYGSVKVNPHHNPYPHQWY